MMLCADVGGSFVDLAVMQADGGLAARHKWPTPVDDWEGFVRGLRQSLATHADMIDPGLPVAMALAGLVGEGDGRITSANLPALHGRTLAADLAAALGRHVVITNDADCFTLAEGLIGAARGHDHVLGLVLGTGVGGGLLAHGRLVATGGVGGEWGHGPLLHRTGGAPGDLPWLRCGCGQWGCLDTIGAARGLERLHLHLHGESLSSRAITSGWQTGDARAGATIERYVDVLSGVLAMLFNVFGATCAPVGGGLATAVALIERLDHATRARMLRPCSEPLIVPGALGGDAGLIGAGLAAGRAAGLAMPKLNCGEGVAA